MNASLIVVYFVGLLISAFLCGVFDVDSDIETWVVLLWPAALPILILMLLYIGVRELGAKVRSLFF